MLKDQIHYEQVSYNRIGGGPGMYNFQSKKMEIKSQGTAHFHLRTYSQVQEIFAPNMMKIKTCRFFTQRDKPTSGKQ